MRTPSLAKKCEKSLKPLVLRKQLNDAKLHNIQERKELFIMLRGHNSSSEDQDENFQNQDFKKIDYNGGFSSQNLDSMNEDSVSQSQSKKIAKLSKKNTNNKSAQPQDKSKAIKKNRESAKMSRLRKKQYQQKLEQKVLELQNEIGERKANVKNISDRIFNKLLRSNKDKYKYLTNKISSSKNLLSLMNEINTLRQSINIQQKLFSNTSLEQQHAQMIKTQYSPTKINGNQPENPNAYNCKQEGVKGKHRKKKCTHILKKGEEKESQSKNGIQQKISQKQALLEICLKNYMYQFGMKGCQRADVIERSKYEWLQALNNYNAEPNEEICNGVARMKHSLQQLDNKSKLLDYHMRELRDKVRDKYAVQFMLDRQLFVKNSAQIIHKNSQLKKSQS